MTCVLLVTDANLNVLGDPISASSPPAGIGGWTQIQATRKFNEPGSYQFTAPAAPSLLERTLGPGNRIVLIRDGVVWCAGPIEYGGDLDWSLDDEQHADPGLVTVRWTDDLMLIAARDTYPDPAHASTAQTAATKSWTATSAETILYALVDDNAGPSAIAARQIPHLALATSIGIGDVIDYSTRFAALGDELRNVALIGGGLGVQTNQDAGQIVFSAYQPVDKSGRVRFSRGLGNLLALSYRPQAPTATVAIVGGDGTGATRTIRERVDSAALAAGWPRMETFVSHAGTDTEMDQQGDATLASSAARAQLSVVAIDVADQRYGVDYQLGDIVAVEIYPGTQIADVVRAVTLTADAIKGELVSPQIGNDSASTDSAYNRALAGVFRRLNRIEGADR